MIDINYYNDSRVRARSKWYQSFSERDMTAVIDVDGEDVEVPCIFVVCDTCEGTGKHVNPSIDCDGLTSNDFYDDPDFKEDYFNGMYDVKCYGCEGKRVVPLMNREAIDKDLLSRIDRSIEEDEMHEAERQSERRYGA